MRKYLILNYLFIFKITKKILKGISKSEEKWNKKNLTKLNKKYYINK